MDNLTKRSKLNVRHIWSNAINACHCCDKIFKRDECFVFSNSISSKQCIFIQDNRTIIRRRLNGYFRIGRTQSPQNYHTPTSHTRSGRLHQTAYRHAVDADRTKRTWLFTIAPATIRDTHKNHSCAVEFSSLERSGQLWERGADKLFGGKWWFDFLIFIFFFLKKRRSMRKATKHFDRWSIVHRHNRMWTRIVLTELKGKANRINEPKNGMNGNIC